MIDSSPSNMSANEKLYFRQLNSQLLYRNPYAIHQNLNCVRLDKDNQQQMALRTTG